MPEREYVYEAEVRWTGEKKGDLILSGKPDLPVATPPEFGGHDGRTSPEDLFVASAVVCLMSTFLAMAQKVQAEWDSFSCSAKATLEKVEGRGLLFTKMDLYPRVSVRSDDQVESVKKALDLAKKYCLVTNSMKTEVVMHPEVSRA